jgi:hypothetical protein
VSRQRPRPEMKSRRPGFYKAILWALAPNYIGGHRGSLESPLTARGANRTFGKTSTSAKRHQRTHALEQQANFPVVREFAQNR